MSIYRYFTMMSMLLLNSIVFSQKIGVYQARGDSYNSIESIAIISDVSGYPIDVIDCEKDISKTLEDYDVVFIIDSKTFNASAEVLEVFNSFIERGGILLADYYSPIVAEPLFGVHISQKENGKGLLKTDTHQKIVVNEHKLGDAAVWLDDDLEKEIYLCKPGKVSFNVYDLELKNAKSIANYEDGAVAISCLEKGLGKAYFFGASFKRLVTFPRNNRDISAQRSYSNGFEPGADIVPLLFRGIVESHFPVTVWKHTLPNNYKSVLSITHDVDCSTGYDSTHFFIDYELEHNLAAHYFMTTRYVHDKVSCPYYTQAKSTTGCEVLNNLLYHNFTVGSHSVGHFEDFGDREKFPLGDMGVSKSTYSPYNDGENTEGGTVLGELLVSKQILESDGEPDVVSFRSGHLAFNKYQPEGLEMCGYTVESSFSANDVMTGFPYILYKQQSSTKPLVDVLEIPLHISDVIKGISRDNYLETVDRWFDVVQRYDNNYSPVTLLVHPTRCFKIDAIDDLIKRTNGKTQVVGFEDINEFWRERRSFSYNTSIDDGKLIIIVPDDALPISSTISLHITNGKKLDEVSVLSASGLYIPFELEDWDDNDYLLRFKSSVDDFEIKALAKSCASLEMEFSIADADFDSLLYDFGDGETLLCKTLDPVKHSYSSSRYYSPKMTVWSNGIKCKLEKRNAIYFPKLSSAKFKIEFEDESQLVPFKVNFLNTSKVDEHDSIEYSWFIDGVQVENAEGGKDLHYVFNSPGTYKVQLEALSGSGCVDVYAQIIQVNGIVNTAVKESSSFVRVIPNPTHDKVRIATRQDFKCASVQVLKLNGEVLFYCNDIQQDIPIDIEQGVCLIKVVLDGKSYIEKIVKL